ncbi:MAG: FHA domain-containing serine/threonine-protein kinase [Planctomycetota bacterium]
MSGQLELHLLGKDTPPTALPKSGTLVIGSSSERAGLILDGQGVEDAHCAIGVVKGGGWAIKDLGSRYGTMVNGKKVGSARIAAGDLILVGSRRLKVVDPSAPADAEAPAAPKASTAAPEAEAPAPKAEAPAPAPKPKAKPKPEPAAAPAAAKGQVGIPKKIGGYRVDRLLGRGGMGTVLLAQQESLNRPVALKVLSPRLAADADFVRRFQKEARAAAALSHPNVVVVYDVGEEGGFHFLSMEYMEKGSLEDRLKTEGKLPWREALDVLHDAAGGLVFAEERGIVHRDIKPANLMQNAAGTIKIADLGLATHMEAEATESEGKKIFGTPHFISPEQARGEAVDHRSDLYSLGATAYQLMTGHTPFEGESTRDILRGHFTEEPPGLRRHTATVPEGVEALVLRLLAKEPDARPQSAGALLAEVDRLRLEADHGVGGRPAPTSKSKAPLLIGGGVVAVLGIGAALMLGGGGGDETDNGGEALAGGGTSVVDAGDPAPGGPEGTGDEELFSTPTELTPGEDGGEVVEAELRERDLLAENAYLRIDTALSKQDRIGALQALIAEYAGTDTASLAGEEVVRLRTEIAQAEAAEAELKKARGAAEATLRQLCALPTPEGELPRPGDQLRQALTFATPPDMAEPEAAALVDAIETEIVAAALTAFRGELDRADALASDGRFEDIKSLLGELLPRLDLPDYEAGTEPAGYGDLKLLGTEVRGRIERVPGEAKAWAALRAQSDRQAIAQGLIPGGGLRSALERLDLDATEAALDALSSALNTDEARTFTSDLRADVQATRTLLNSLVQEFARDGWRRRTITDPRSGRPRDVLNATAIGLTVDVRGSSEEVAWSEFAGNTEALSQLVRDRLSRDLNADERRGAAGLLRISAAVEAAGLAQQMLDPGGDAHFSDAEAESMRELFEELDEWAGEEPRLAREQAAGEVLAQALLDLEAGAWASAEAGLQGLLTEYADTLLVALLSDGSSWAEEEG